MKYIVFTVMFLMTGVAHGGECRAWTQCRNGEIIQCMVYGDFEQPCNWYVTPFHYVECVGYDQEENPVHIINSCYPYHILPYPRTDKK